MNVNERSKMPLSSNAVEILSMEFEYASKTAEQANSDRATVVNFYVVFVGAVASSLLTAQNPASDLAFGFGGLVVFVIGLGAHVKLIRLRQAWHDSARAMNQIKDYFLEQSFDSDADLHRAFRWKSSTLRTLSETWTITFYLMLVVVFVNSSALGAGIYHVSCHVNASLCTWPSQFATICAVALAFILSFVGQLCWFFFMLSKSQMRLAGSATPPFGAVREGFPLPVAAGTERFTNIATPPPTEASAVIDRNTRATTPVRRRNAGRGRSPRAGR